MELDTLEAFALADDRAKILEQLIPGTEDYYFAHCLEHQHRGEFDKVPPLVKTWISRHNQTARVNEILNRQALLTWDTDPDGAYERIKDRVSVHLSHQREVAGEETHYPTRLDFEALMKAFRQRALGRSHVSEFTDRALDWVIREDLSADQRRDLLSRLRRPDYANLVDLVVADLEYQHSSGFGSHPIHGLLLREQLDELARKRPSLCDEDAFVAARVVRLQPGPDDDWEHDPQVRRAYLERLWGFVAGLAPSFNSLKTHVLFHLLDLDRTQGTFDRARFDTYLRLPRQVSYANPDYLRADEHRHHVAQLGASFTDQTLLDTVHDDEPLVRALLARVLVEAEGFEGLETLIRKSYLKRLRAETKILAGVGDMETWYSELNDPSYYQSLKERVDLEFAPTNKTAFRGDEVVSLDLFVKNVSTLVVKVFAINTFNHFLAKNQQVDTTIDLDGLVAGAEETHTYDEPPLRRVRRTFELPGLSEPGVYVVELIGNGRSSRALIRKGCLRMLERVGAAGHVFSILDEDNAPAPDATLWLAGREYKADEDGDIVVPFTTSPRRARVLLRRGDLTTVESFNHVAEHYEFTAGIHVDRESLLAKQKAQVLLRPLLRIDGRPVSLELIDDAKLVIESTDRHGVSTSKEVGDLELFPDRETVYTLSVPEDLAEISFTLRGKVKRISGGDTLDVSAARGYSINQIDTTDSVEALHLAPTDEGYVLYLLGKTGETRSGRPVEVTFHHQDYTDDREVTLQTDDAGRIELGALAGITAVEAESPSNVSGNWTFLGDGCRLAPVIHGRAGETLLVPYTGSAAKVTREAFSLLERRGNGYVRDRFGDLGLSGGYLELRGLGSGDYDLLIKDPLDGQRQFSVRLAPGTERGHWVAGSKRLLERGDPKPLHVPSATYSGEGGLTIRLAGTSPHTRVHVFGSRYQAEHAPADLGPLTPTEPGTGPVVRDESHYVSGRDIGDEYRYILERRFGDHLPGNMLARPGLLLNPWSVRETDTDLNLAVGGGSYDKKSAKERMAKPRPGAQGATFGGDGDGGFANLDFLAQPAVVVPNLSPDAEGAVRIPAEVLAGVNRVQVVAVDRTHTVWRLVALPEADAEHKDLRLRLGLDPKGHFTERNQVTCVDAGGVLEIADITTSQLEVYDTLARVYTLYATLSGDSNLDAFGFILRWPTLEREEKCKLYSEFACHELHVFLSRKDPEFFDEVVRPYLTNKRHKTFMDRYLLGEDLAEYLEPWAHGRLNIVERILLGGRSDDGGDAAKRHVGDLQALLRRDPEQQTHLFRTAVQGSALDTDDALGLAEATEARQEEMVASLMSTGGGGFGAGLAGMSPPRMSSPKAKRSRRASAKSMAPPPPPCAAPMEMEMCAEEEECDDEWGGEGAVLACADEMGMDDGFFDKGGYDDNEKKDLGRRDEIRQFYRSPETTQELAENDYYKLTVDRQGPELVTVNAFWRDLAAHMATPNAGPFTSPAVAEAHRNFTEMMLALAVLDLPFTAETPATDYEGARLELGARKQAIVFHKEIKPAPEAEQHVPILVSQNYFRADDRYRYDESGEQRDNYVTGEFLVHRVYRCQVVLTNPTSSAHKLELLLQIPRGALPVENGFQTRGRNVHLGSYATHSLEYGFYFPAPGDFAHYPVHVSKNEELIASADPALLTVVLQPSEVDETSWAYISQNGTTEQVLAYLEAHNVERIPLERIAWRMKEEGFYTRVIALLRARRAYDQTLWGYSFKFRDTPNMAEFLKHENSFMSSSGLRLEGPLVNIDPIARRRYEHLEYAPLVNARAHRLGGKLKILNDRLAQQYQRFVTLLSYRPRLDADDRLAAAYYLLLQDRVEEGLALFQTVDAEGVETRLQLDYMRAYAAFYGDAAAAREIAMGYAEYPVDRWRKLFRNVLAQLDEAEGDAARVVDTEDRAQKQDDLASTEASLELAVEGGVVTIQHRNLAQVTLNTYAMDIELLFSRQPFVQQQSGQFSFIAPNHTAVHDLSGEETRLELPEAYKGSNVIVEAAAAGIRRSKAHYSHELSVQVVETYGQVRVAHLGTRKPLAGAYVKAYARFGGGDVRFFKDGYTDVRGRFDYASLSTDDLGRVQRFALLIMSAENGAVIHEANPPKQ